ncbi:MAG TPA: hypothetical protein VE090_02140 [Methylomirabilota bacterium]|nr:hypothetical protein [Methylomirabilota bacterium]
MNFDNIRTIAEVILAIGVFALAAGYTWSQFKSGKSAAVKDLNDTLNELLKARDVQIADLVAMSKSNTQRIAYLEGQVETLSSKKTDLETLIKAALQTHLDTHPEVAKELFQNMQKTA